jgi:hypothetical protein
LSLRGGRDQGGGGEDRANEAHAHERMIPISRASGCAAH